jgi:hypothetical protein
VALQEPDHYTFAIFAPPLMRAADFASAEAALARRHVGNASAFNEEIGEPYDQN